MNLEKLHSQRSVSESVQRISRSYLCITAQRYSNRLSLVSNVALIPIPFFTRKSQIGEVFFCIGIKKPLFLLFQYLTHLFTFFSLISFPVPPCFFWKINPNTIIFNIIKVILNTKLIGLSVYFLFT